ncbi:hypothetical protein TPHA_0A05030 [Tetrapisispora phaffii CBS 4417]|uniref:SVP1-like protein 2 n=1 Tax=Tetrapisispora phaffii (strain ATCC 24235 / CBS 4417 / NBRC 1672 / NRRL Y-8282 / UCD 70-5) TaxID=1071381 RepID=G8BNV0_TETPH|nr:hypothetical protein TPHA_0A05030 [Tetrapisispora phaffii CBS 4417]CCE61578.1 hypothetical protein TPHA_0A05030 [Tetrapisispora phaffii CBS 4417]
MNVRSNIVNTQSVRHQKFLDISFNQDESCFSCSSENGFKVYNSNPLSCKLTYISNDQERCGIAYSKMLHRTNYIALLGGGLKPKYPPNKLIVWDDLKKKESIVLKFMSPLKSVFISRIYIIAVLANSIEIFQFQPKTVKICPSLSIEHNSTCDFVICQNNRSQRRGTNESNSFIKNKMSIKCYLAYVSPRMLGQIHIADLSQLRYNENNPDESQLLPTSIIKAHKSAIRLVRLNKQGTMVATCSRQGTLIRIFSTINGVLLKEFRRGLDRADIYEMSFSPNGTRLAVISDKQTLHIFQLTSLQSEEGNENDTNKEKDNFNHNKTHVLRNYVPHIWKPKYIYSVWSMCSLHLKNPLLRDGLNSNEPDLEFLNDRCKIGWSTGTGNDDNDNYYDEDTLILVWKGRGIWEKYVILEHEHNDENDEMHSPKVVKNYTINETLNRDASSTAPKKKKWELVRESWREL